MDPTSERPGPARGYGPSWTVSRVAERPDDNGGKRQLQRLTFRLGPDDPAITVTGRLAQTLALLIRVEPFGFTSGEASPLGWARRTSHYIRQLRLAGVPILTTREQAGDALIGRYRLTGPVYVVADEGATP